MRALLIGMAVWIGCILCGALSGGFLSSYTGKSEDLPKWNGWAYFWFCFGDFAKISAVLALPVAIIAFAITRAVMPTRPPSSEASPKISI